MVDVAVFTQPGSGSTTLLGLLYASMVRQQGSAGDRFRISVASTSLRPLTKAYEQLLLGEFPTDDPSAPASSIEITMAFRRSAIGSLLGRWGSSGGQTAFSECKLNWNVVPLAALHSFVKFGTQTTTLTRTVQSCSVVVLTVSIEPPDLPAAADSPPLDSSLAAGLRYLAGRPVAPKEKTGQGILPLVVFTKIDRLSKKARAKVGLPTSPAETAREGSENRAGRVILGRLLPETLRALDEGMYGRGTALRPMECFYSWVETEPASPETGPRIRRERRPDGSTTPIYAVGELGRFIERFRTFSD
jgi:hypothetical protein